MHGRHMVLGTDKGSLNTHWPYIRDVLQPSSQGLPQRPDHLLSPAEYKATRALLRRGHQHSLQASPRCQARLAAFSRRWEPLATDLSVGAVRADLALPIVCVSGHAADVSVHWPSRTKEHLASALYSIGRSSADKWSSSTLGPLPLINCRRKCFCQDSCIYLILTSSLPTFKYLHVWLLLLADGRGFFTVPLSYVFPLPSILVYLYLDCP